MSAVLERPVADGTGTAGSPDPDPAPPPGVLARAAAVLAVAAVAVALGWSVLIGAGDGLPSGAVAVVLSGTVEQAAGDGWDPVDAGGQLAADTRVRAVDGVVALEVDGGELRLNAGSHLTLGAEVLRLERGSVVALGDARTIEVDALRVVGEGTWRVDDGGQPRVAVYEGEARVDDGASTVEVPRLRQLSVRDGVVAGNGVQPLRYLATDPFDATLLAVAFRVDDLAESLLRSLASEHGAAPRELAFYRAFVPVDDAVEERLRDAAAEVDADRFGPPAEVLLTAVLIDAVVVETGSSATEATAAVVDLRRDGATWGLLALDRGIDGEALAAAADRALERAEADPPPDAPAPAPSAPSGADDATPPSPAPTGDTAPAPSPSAPAPSSPSPPPPDGGGDPEPDDGGALGGAEDLLRDTGSGAGGLVEDTTDTVGDVVGGVDQLLAPGGGLLAR